MLKQQKFFEPTEVIWVASCWSQTQTKSNYFSPLQKSQINYYYSRTITHKFLKSSEVRSDKNGLRWTWSICLHSRPYGNRLVLKNIQFQNFSSFRITYASHEKICPWRSQESCTVFSILYSFFAAQDMKCRTRNLPNRQYADRSPGQSFS